MRKLKVLIALLTLVAISGCKNVKIDNGEVPSQYLSQAKKLEGTYHGSFNGVRGDLTIRFHGQRPVVSFKNGNGSDILNNNCGSEVGLLKEVTVKSENKNPRVSNAIFDFDAGTCSLMVEGRHLNIGFKEKNGAVVLNVSILQETRTREVCRLNPGTPPHSPPYHECRTEYQRHFLTGSFRR